MPYISQIRREVIDPEIASVLRFIDEHTNNENGFRLGKGDFNYIVTKIADAWLKAKGLSYDNACEVVSMLINVHDEFKRRVVGPYENIKCDMNGDVYSPENLRG